MARARKNPLVEHEVDGIREYDNPLPRWWVYLFNATIVFSAGYLLYHFFGPGVVVIREYEADMTRLAALRSRLSAAVQIDEGRLAAAYKDAGQVASGRALFESRCASCHGEQGQGLIGPNLTDEYWIHNTAGTLEGIYKVVRDGVPDKGMVAWGKSLKPEQMMQVVAFVASLSGTKPPGPKAPEGTKVARLSWK
jgi:cytochrome c oxidase cbb3-type subunit 3